MGPITTTAREASTMLLEGIRRASVTIGLPVTITFDEDGFMRVTVDVLDVAGELADGVSVGSASVQVLAYGQTVWRDADESETDEVAEYLGEHLPTPWLDVDDAPGWDMVPE